MSLRALTEISKQTRVKVYERDSIDGCPCCVLCGQPLPSGGNLHHVVERSRGGLGNERNLVTLCQGCHRKYHDTLDPETTQFFKEYLASKYEGWKEARIIAGEDMKW